MEEGTKTIQQQSIQALIENFCEDIDFMSSLHF